MTPRTLHMPALPEDCPGRTLDLPSGLYRLVALYAKHQPGFGITPWTVWVQIIPFDRSAP